LRKKGAVGGSNVAGGVYLNLRDGMKNRYLSYPKNTSLTEWYRKWFYIREEPCSATFCDVGYMLEKRASWTDRPEYTGQVEELMSLIDWSHLDGLGMDGNFLSRWSCHARGECTRRTNTREARTRPVCTEKT
jgi:hypothetical protein